MRLAIDPLEARCLLTVTPSLTPILVNQTFGSSQVTTAAHSISADNNGDFVVAWSRLDNVVNSAGVPIIDPSTGNQMTVSDVYARYFTNEVQQVGLPGPGATNVNGTVLPNGIASNFDNDPNSIGTFSVTFNSQTEMLISVTAGTAPLGDTAAATVNPNIAGQFTLWFDANGDKIITANEVTTINFDETNPTARQRRMPGVGSVRLDPPRSAASWSATAATRWSRPSIRTIIWSTSALPHRAWTNHCCCNI